MIVKFKDLEDDSYSFMIDTKANDFNTIKKIAEEVKANLNGESFPVCMKQALRDNKIVWEETVPREIIF